MENGNANSTTRRRLTPAEKQLLYQEALLRAQTGNSPKNDALVILLFSDRGIPESDITPRVNVLTYGAWQAKGRQVRKGEHGERVPVVIVRTVKDARTQEEKTIKTLRDAVVFHVSQTDKVGEAPANG